MNRHGYTFVFAVTALATCNQALSAEAASLTEALTTGNTTLNLRLRNEYVDDEAFASTANAATLRSRLSYTSATWQGLDLTLELDHVAHIADDRFNSTRNNKPLYPQVTDPEGADLNQANLRYRRNNFNLVAGRQRINRDNQRFIGSVGWRQNEQTLDAISGGWKVSEQLQVDYAWVNSTRRIFGPDSGTPPAALDSAHHLLNAGWQFSPQLRAGAYYYALDFEDAATLSSTTAGVFVQGEKTFEALTADYRLELAEQKDNADNPLNYSADYLHATLGIKVDQTRFALSHEVLGSNGVAAVQTPLATLHAFQGWADKFLTTPAAGLKDTWLSVTHRFGEMDLTAALHDYSSDKGSVDYGREWNLQLVMPVNSNVTLTAKFADYTADAFGSDTRKFWLMAEARF